MQGSGAFRADVPVIFEDRNGNPVLAVVTDGPMWLAGVPPGRYRIRTADGEERAVDVGVTVVYFHSRTE